jgi:hypothetical protein
VLVAGRARLDHGQNSYDLGANDLVAWEAGDGGPISPIEGALYRFTIAC